MQPLPTPEFLKRAKVVHGDRYDYSLVYYMLSKTNLEIICKKHGKFLQKPGHHLAGQGCRKCADESQIGQYTEKLFLKTPELKNKKATLYFIQFENECKIGITTQTIKKRFLSYGLNYSILFHTKIPLYEAFLKEQKIKAKYSNGFRSKIINGGSTECFPYSNELKKQILGKLSHAS